MTRIACLYVPLFPLAARLRSEPELAGEIVAICEGNGSAARVVAASRPARKAGLRPGTSLAQARGILPALIARGRDPGCETSAHEALLETGWSLSPRVEDAELDLVYADVDGMTKLYDGERDLGQAAEVTATSLDLPIRVGIAANKLAARLAARQPGSPTVVPPGSEIAFLAALPLRHLRLERRLAETLSRWGVATLGDLARLPADRVASRLGPAGAAAHQSARGIDPQPLVAHQPAATLSEGMELEWPVVTLDPLLAAVRQLLDRIRRRLEAHDLACALLSLELGLEPEGSDRRTIRLPAPTRDVDALVALIRIELDARPPGAAVAAFACFVHPNRPRRGQLTLFGAAEIHPDKLAATIARIAGRIGPDRVGAPTTVDGHLPERYDVVPFDPPPAPKLKREPKNGRGLLAVRVLRPPVPLEVITEEVNDSANSQFSILNSQLPSQTQPTAPAMSSDGTETQNSKLKTKNSSAERDAIKNSQLRIENCRLVSVSSEPGATPRIQGLIRVAAGPWSLEDGWWNERPVERDYWDVELSGGRLIRIYRDRTTGDWFADGMYD
ncbi:MAG: DNA polymerase Y family protein [Holophagae bacterium]|jgi:protein ImuB